MHYTTYKETKRKYFIQFNTYVKRPIVIYCANLQYGNFDEFCFVIDELKKNNIPIYGVELGNEYNLMGYRKLFPDVYTYIKKIKTNSN